MTSRPEKSPKWGMLFRQAIAMMAIIERLHH
jgi:hypothetical protein